MVNNGDQKEGKGNEEKKTQRESGGESCDRDCLAVYRSVSHEIN